MESPEWDPGKKSWFSVAIQVYLLLGVKMCFCLCSRYLQRGSKVSVPGGPDHREDARSSLHRHSRAGASILLPWGGSQRDVSSERREGRHSICPLPGRTPHWGCVCFIRLWWTCPVCSEETQGNPGEEIHWAVQKYGGRGPAGMSGCLRGCCSSFIFILHLLVQFLVILFLLRTGEKRLLRKCRCLCSHKAQCPNVWVCLFSPQ